MKQKGLFIFVFSMSFFLWTRNNFLFAESFYKGTCISGNCKNGYGTMIWAEGRCPGKRYVGYFKKSKPHGYGKFDYPCTGASYFGEFAGGKEHGFGIEQFPDGDSYTGEWREGRMQGIGIIATRGLAKRLGKVKNGIAQGAGLLVSQDETIEREDIYEIKPTRDKKSKTRVYVPKDLEDSFRELKAMLMPELLDKMKNGSQEKMSMYHYGLGMWMRNNWGLWSGSRFAKYFNALGINNADDMSGIILDVFWNHLNGRPLQIEERVKIYQGSWKKEKQGQ